VDRDVSPLDGFPEPYGLLCAILQDASRDWRQELAWQGTRDEIDAIFTAEVVTRRMRPGGPSIGAIMLHMIVVEIFWFEVFVLGREFPEEDARLLMANEIEVDEGKWPDPPHQPLTWYFDLQDRYRARSLELIKEWPSPETTKEASWGNRYTPRWVLGHVIQHESYHGGQINMLADALKAPS
jgi:uncharacterized damage-inducible protein DinB